MASPLVLVLLIPAIFFVWAQMGSPHIPISSMIRVATRNGRFIMGAILLASVILAVGAVFRGQQKKSLDFDELFPPEIEQCRLQLR
jgi:hypothetical protein